MSDKTETEWVQIDFSSSMKINRRLRFENLSKGKVMVALARATCAIQGEGTFNADVERILKDAEQKLLDASTRKQEADAILAAARNQEYRIIQAEARASQAEAKASTYESEALNAARLREEASNLRRQLESVSRELQNARTGVMSYPNIRSAPVLPPSASPGTRVIPGAVTEIIDSIRSGGTGVSDVKPPRGYMGGLEID